MYFHEPELKEKECSCCYVTKPINQFSTETYYRDKSKKIKAQRFRSRCKKCESKAAVKRVKRERDRLKKEGKLTEHYRKKKKKEVERIGIEAYRKKERENARARRVAMGVKSNGGWKKYREGRELGNRLDPEPIRRFILEYMEKNNLNKNQFAAAVHMDQARITSILAHQTDTVTEHTVDTILIKLFEQDKWYWLYPGEDSE